MTIIGLRGLCYMDEKQLKMAVSETPAELLNRLARAYVLSQLPRYRRLFNNPITALFFYFSILRNLFSPRLLYLKKLLIRVRF